MIVVVVPSSFLVLADVSCGLGGTLVTGSGSMAPLEIMLPSASVIVLVVVPSAFLVIVVVVPSALVVLAEVVLASKIGQAAVRKSKKEPPNQISHHLRMRRLMFKAADNKKHKLLHQGR